MLVLRDGERVAGRYQLLSILGRGGMGEIWSARDLSTDRIVAIKFMQTVLGIGQSEVLARFEREVRVLSTIDNPHIIRLFDFGVTQEVPYLVMGLLEGEESLDQRLRRERMLAPSAVATMATGIASALEHLHGRGILHRDIKPGNIYFARKDGVESVKVLDFGLVRGTAREATLTLQVVGTPLYMSPERIQGGGDHRSDLWSFAVVLFEALEGILPSGPPRTTWRGSTRCRTASGSRAARCPSSSTSSSSARSPSTPPIVSRVLASCSMRSFP